METPLPNRPLGQALLAVARQPTVHDPSKKFTSILFVLCFVQEKSAAPTFKILLVLFPTPTIIYAYQRPSSTPLPKSVIGTIPNTNNYLRYPAPIFKIYIQKYYFPR